MSFLLFLCVFRWFWHDLVKCYVSVQVTYLLDKTSLIKFLIQEWRTEKHLEKLGHLHKVVFVTCEEKCFRFSVGRCREVPELQCVQEEADGRLLLHASHTAEAGYEAVMISSNDTDVFVLNMVFCVSYNTFFLILTKE